MSTFWKKYIKFKSFEIAVLYETKNKKYIRNRDKKITIKKILSIFW